MMENEKLNALIDEIRKTRAEQSFMENRLLAGEKLIRGMSIYYAAFASVAAVLSLVYPNLSFSELSAVLTVALSLLVIALCAQRYSELARHYHVNAYALGQLLLEAQQEDGENEGGSYKLRTLREKYALIMNSASGRSAHENRAVLRMYDVENRRRVLTGEEVLKTHYLSGYEKFQYWFVEIMSLAAKALIFTAPAACLTLVAVGLI